MDIMKMKWKLDPNEPRQIITDEPDDGYWNVFLANTCRPGDREGHQAAADLVTEHNAHLESLAAMTAERDVALNERNHFVGCLQGAREAEQTMHENRNALMRELQAMTAARGQLVSLVEGLHRQLNEMTAAKELTERQVAVLLSV